MSDLDGNTEYRFSHCAVQIAIYNSVRSQKKSVIVLLNVTSISKIRIRHDFTELEI